MVESGNTNEVTLFDLDITVLSVCDVTTFFDDPLDPYEYDLLSVVLQSPRFTCLTFDPSCPISFHLVDFKSEQLT